MVTHEVQMLHAIPGRIRGKIAKRKDHPALADVLQQKLAGIRVVQTATANSLTGGVLVTYDPRVLESLHTLECGDVHPLCPCTSCSPSQICSGCVLRRWIPNRWRSGFMRRLIAPQRQLLLPWLAHWQRSLARG